MPLPTAVGPATLGPQAPRSSGALADKVRGDAAELASCDPFFSFFRGGVAAFDDGQRVGAVGVSGLPGEQDEALALRALEAAGLAAS